MLNAITLLEKLGQDARLRYATKAELEAALTAANVEPRLRSALLAGPPQRVEALLGAAANVSCGLYAAENDENFERLEALLGAAANVCCVIFAPSDRYRLEALLGATANTCSLIEAYEGDQDRPAGPLPLANTAEAPVLADAPDTSVAACEVQAL